MIDIVYYSKANPDITSQDISDILNTARKFNSKNNVTGCLLYHNEQFLQILEGKEEVVHQLLEAIKKDKRHSNVMVMAEDYKDERLFPEWSMAFHEFYSAETEEKINLKNIPSFELIVQKPTNAIGLFSTMAELMKMD